MKTFNKSLIAAAVGAVAMGSQVANAAWTAPAGPSATTVINQTTTANKTTISAGANAVYTLAAGEGLTANDTITITLTGGAVFSSTTPTLAPSAGDLGAGAATAAVPLSGGTPGSTSAVWRAIDAMVVAGSTLTMNNASAIHTVAAATGSVDLLISLETSTGLPIGTQSQSLNTTLESGPGNGDAFLFVFSPLTTTTTAGVPATDTAQVATGYTLFGGSVTTTTTTTYTTTNQSSGASIPSAPIAAAQLVYTLSGDFTGVTAVNGTGITGSDATGNQTGGTAGAFLIDAANGLAHASNTAAIATGAALPNAITLNIDGTTAQTARTFSLKIDVTADGANYTAHTARASALNNTIARNGTFFTTNATGPLNNIKITDSSGGATASGGEIAIVAFDSSGNVVAQAAGAPALPAAVASNSTVTIKGADLTANYPGAVRFDFTVNTVSATVSNVKKNADGITVTVFGNAAGGVL